MQYSKLYPDPRALAATDVAPSQPDVGRNSRRLLEHPRNSQATERALTMKIYFSAPLLGVLCIATSMPAFGADPKYLGDVPGRALSLAGLEGHVGIWKGGTILEMANNGKGMVETKLADFKIAGHDSNFYGTKGKGAQNRSSVVKAAVDQKSLSPTYTYLAEYWIGGIAKGKKYDLKKKKWVDVTKTFSGKFRCDTLVNYAYKYGGAGYIKSMTEKDNTEFSSATEYYVRKRGFTTNIAGQTITPKQLYNALPETR
jgi:hypothetical protein